MTRFRNKNFALAIHTTAMDTLKSLQLSLSVCLWGRIWKMVLLRQGFLKAVFQRLSPGMSILQLCVRDFSKEVVCGGKMYKTDQERWLRSAAKFNSKV